MSCAEPPPAGAVELDGREQRQLTELEAIFSAHADGLVIYGRDGEIRAMNPAARVMFRAEQGEDYAACMAALAPVDECGHQLELHELPSRRALQGELVKGFVMAVHTPAGDLWYSASAAPLWTADREIAGAVLSCVDITHLQRLKEEREEVVRALTHDARTRLNVIRTHGELLGRTAVSEEDARRRAAVIVASSRQLAGIIDALVDGR